MSQPKVSVIIPVYNTSQYLYDAVGSVIQQTLQKIEIICIDDGSTDNSLDILNKLANVDNRIIVVHQENQGLSCARNTGVKYAHGKFLYFMDSDDILLETCLEDCYNKANLTNADFIFFDADVFYEKDAKLLTWNYHRTQFYNSAITYKGTELLNNMLDKHIHRSVVWLLFIRTAFIKSIEIEFYPKLLHEDELYTVLLYLHSSKISCIQKSYVRHRIRTSSIMGKKYSIRNINCYLTVIEQLHHYIKKEPQHKVLIKKYSRYTLNAVFETAFVLSFSEKIKAFYRLCASGYIKYVDFIVILKFWLKQKNTTT